MARVIWTQEDGREINFPLSDNVVIGRDPSADCKLEARSVSRRHALIEMRDGCFYLRDLGSTNGTSVNGKPIDSEAELRVGDRIEVGAERLRFEVETTPDRDADLRVGTRSVLATEPLSRTLHKESLEEGRELIVRKGTLPEALPRRVGKFHLVDKIGQGGMGSVYRAIDLESNQEVAVKFIRQQIGRKESFLQMFHHREAVLAREIDHDNVIRVLEHGVEAEQHFISMEFIHGQSLYHIAKQRKLSPAEVLDTLRQIACGLAAAHRQGVVHSDIKPANILIAESSTTTEVETVVSENGNSAFDEGGILEFSGDDSTFVHETDESPARDIGLLAEIQKRVGGVSKDLLVDPPYFPRPSEMQFLEHYFEASRGGLGRDARGEPAGSPLRGYFVLVEGESGTGKSRLISEFILAQKSRADLAGRVCFHEIDCSRIEGIIDLYQGLHGYQDLQGGVTKEQVKARQMVEDIKARLLELEQPMVLRAVDFGKATSLVCDLLSWLGGQLAEKPFLVVASIDPEEVRKNDSAKILIDLLANHRKELYLRPLTQYQIDRYIATVFHDSLVDPALSADLFRLSGGNFTRLLDLLRSFFERGALKLDANSSRVLYRQNFRELELEEGKNLYEKFRQYSMTEQRVLTSAAFVGERFFFDTLSKLQDIDETALFFLVRQLLADGFLSEEGRTWFSFTNVAFQRYLAERVTPPERPHLHRKLTRLLQNVPVRESAELYQLRGRHFAGCREYSKAVRSLLEGAQLARNVYKTDLARELYQEVLRIYRELSSKTGPRREVIDVLRKWFRRDGNWYEILGDVGADDFRATVKIADFGISFRVDDGDRGYQVGKRPALGTPRYLAPERGRGEPGGPPADIFALGVIAYELLVGEPPFPDLKGSEIVQAYQELLIKFPATALSGYPDGFESLLHGLVERDAGRRPDAERVVRELVKLQYDLRLGSRRGFERPS